MSDFNMKLLMQRFLILFYILSCPFLSLAKAEKDNVDQSPAARIKKDIEFLTSDQCEGRLTGSKGELIVANYIENRFKEMKLAPYKGKYKWEFVTKTGVKVGDNAYFKIFDQALKIGNEVIVLPYSSGSKLSGATYPRVFEEGNVWMVSFKDIKISETNSVQKLLHEHAKKCIDQGASSVLFYNDVDAFQDLTQLNLQPMEMLDKPVCVINHKAYERFIKANLKRDWINIDAVLGFEDASATGKNVVAHIDNKAPFTIVIGAHYDYLGNFGENYKGADDNASGVAALLHLSEMIFNARLKNYNYLFVAFSGKEQGLQGSKTFLQQNEFLVPNIAAMIDLDMLGRFSATRELYVSGIGTSPSWIEILQMGNKGFKFNADSSGYGYSDYTTFYNKNIPVLRISTGYHEDYMKPTDIVSKINTVGIYDIVQFATRFVSEMDRRSRMVFNKTNDILPKLEKLKSDLGIIPDFAYADNGIRIAACIPNKTAFKSGMNSGDVITKIGPFTIVDFDDYMEAIRKSESGREVTVVVKRGKLEYKFFVVM